MKPIDCDEVLGQVWRFLDGELDEAQVREFQVHIAECGECGSRVEFQRRLLAIIQIKCKAGPVPAHLKQRLFRLLERES